MEGEVKGKTFKMNGHTLPGINQRSDAKATNVAEQGLAGSSALQQNPMMGTMTGADRMAQKMPGAGMQGVNPSGGMVPNIGAGVGTFGSGFPHKPSMAKDAKKGFGAYPSMRKLK